MSFAPEVSEDLLVQYMHSVLCVSEPLYKELIDLLNQHRQLQTSD